LDAENKRSWLDLHPNELFGFASRKFFAYWRKRNYGKCKKWSVRLAHAALTLYPELREENSLNRYFVAKLGREQGFSGAQLTEFVEKAYKSGLAEFAIKAGLSHGPRKYE